MSSTAVKSENTHETAVFTYKPEKEPRLVFVVIEADGSSTENEFPSPNTALLDYAEDGEVMKKLNDRYLAETDLCSTDDNSEDFENWILKNIEEITGCRIDPRIRSGK